MPIEGDTANKEEALQHMKHFGLIRRRFKCSDSLPQQAEVNTIPKAALRILTKRLNLAFNSSSSPRGSISFLGAISPTAEVLNSTCPCAYPTLSPVAML